MTEKTYRYSEIFYSPQGEGKWITGEPSVWIRWFLCNLQCEGFGQTNPADPATHDESIYKTFDLKDITDIKQLPVWEKGCDSSYSWSKRYRHLCPQDTAHDIALKIIDAMKNKYNPLGMFRHPHSGEEIALTMTGGEPMFSQPAAIALIDAFNRIGNSPAKITVETNGTQPLNADMERCIAEHVDWTRFKARDTMWFWSVSPKLLNTSGEANKRAIKPEVVAQYHDVSANGQLKFVVNGTQESWDELEEVIAQYRNVGVNWPISIMPVGATVEDQSKPTVGEIANEATARGYHVSARMQCYLYGNVIGV